MFFRRPSAFFPALLLASALSFAAAPRGVSAAGTSSARPVTPSLDQAMVQRYYSEGDFDPAIALLEEFQRTHATCSRAESVMVYKYLGVMYAADPGTREKGKSYFYKLLRVDSDAKILDMYVSIVVQDIFKNTLDELMGALPVEPRAAAPAAAPVAVASAAPSPAPPPAPPRTPTAKRKGRGTYWLLGGLGIAAVAAAGAGYYAYSASDTPAPRKPEDELIEVTP